MFNLIIRADETRPMVWSRMLEGVPADVAMRYKTATGYDFEELAKLPTIAVREFQEDDTSTVATLGYMDEPSINPRISTPVLRFPAYKLLGQVIFGAWGGTHTCWTLCDGDPFRMFAPFALSSISSPHIGECEPDLVAVMMPFADAAEIDPVYRAIREGVSKVGMKCIRVDELKTPTDIVGDIRDLIAKSRMVIADLTGLNHNVMYEIGLAEGMGKSVVRICRDGASGLPFDISHYRVIAYHRDGSGLDDLCGKIAAAVDAAMEM